MFERANILQAKAMRAARKLGLAALLVVALVADAAVAQTTTTNSGSSTLPPAGKVPIPTDLQGLVKKFEKERSAYLAQQNILLARLKNATTPAQRAAIRAELQQNREEFIADLKEFRQDLKQEITELKDKLNNTELDRLIQEVQHEVDTHNHHGKT